MDEIGDREHLFYITVAKFLFLHRDHGLVSVRDPIGLAEADLYSLQPLILYGVTVRGLPLRWLSFSRIDELRDLGEVLSEAWMSARGLRGVPDRLRVSRHLAANSEALRGLCINYGVELVVADAKEKVLPAVMRASQERSRWLGWHWRASYNRDDPVCELRKLAAREHGDSHSLLKCESGSLEEQARWRAWTTLDVHYLAKPIEEKCDWTGGKWLTSWEGSVPLPRKRYFHKNNEGAVELLRFDSVSYGDDEEEGWDYSFYSVPDDRAELLKSLLQNWPNPPIHVAQAVGLTVKELRWLATDKMKFDDERAELLCTMLGIAFNSDAGSYAVNGPLLLVAQVATALGQTYSDVSGGGDAHPLELLPQSGVSDPSWRYFLVNGYGDRLVFIMAPRGEAITEKMPQLLFNFAGEYRLSPEVFRDVVVSCARAARSPLDNRVEMLGLEQRHDALWRELQFASYY